ncbi:MAG: N-acetylmuramoyl-L-alanine amidase [Cyclobacteriaceae bacterium]
MRKVIAITSDIVKPVKNIGFKALLLAITLLFFSATPRTNADNVIDLVVIDAGHGGKDPGTHGINTLEKDVALSIALKVGEYITKYVPGVKVIYTRTDDTFIPLDERAKIANRNNADLFICIHANALGRPEIYGTETYVMGPHNAEGNMEVAKRENSVILLDENHEERYEGFDPNSPESYILFSLAQSAFQESSIRFANFVESQFRDRVGRKSRGVKQAGFWVLWRTGMPSVLIETGYLTNPTEEKYLKSERGQELIASGIYRAFKEYKAQIESVK